MRKLIITIIAGMLIFPCSLSAKKLQAFMSYSTFNSPTDGPYIETYLTVVGNSVVFVRNANGKYQGTIEVTLIFSQKDVVKQFKKINLLSPEVDDTNAVNFNFIDQQRFLLPNGEYTTDIMILDKNDKAEPYKASETIDINYPKDKASVSGIEFIESFTKSETPSVLTKSGYDLVPYILNYYPETITKLTFYSEIYNTDIVFGNEEKYLLSTFIETYETGLLYGDLVKVKKETAKSVNVLFGEFDISSLPSGNYNIVVEVRDKSNSIVSFNKMFFQRNHPSLQVENVDMTNANIENTFVSRVSSADSMADYVKSLYPVSSETERQYARTLLKLKDLKNMQQYFYNFWITRNKNNPEGAWLLYKQEVDKVNANFGTKIRRGYETDRGRVYLQYGPPNQRMENANEPSAYPYEIWQYYTLGNQKNKKFVFYSSDMVTNDYELIHSDAIGEVNDYKWKDKIYKRNTPSNDPYSNGVIDHWGERSDDFFKNPR
jgi:GWxTD domain-containing protein